MVVPAAKDEELGLAIFAAAVLRKLPNVPMSYGCIQKTNVSISVQQVILQIG